MAIIYSYPEKTTPAGGDFLVITDSEQPAPKKNRTKSLTIDNLASYVITSTGAITGGGTLNTIAMFTPDGQTIGDSFMTYNPQNQFFVISKRLQIDGDLIVDGRGNFNGDYLRVNCPLQDGSGLSGTAGQVLSSTGTGVEWISAGSGTVTGTGTPTTLTMWDAAGTGIEDSSITYSAPANTTTILSSATEYKFGAGAFSAPVTNGFDFKTNGLNGGFYKSGGFRFENKLAVGRTFDPTGATLDVGTASDTVPAAYFRNGVVLSNNPGGVQVDNTSMVIGAGNNDVVSGSDNCLAVGNNNQILNDSDNSLAVGQGNKITNNADNCFIIGQSNEINGVNVPFGNSVRSQVLGYDNLLFGSYSCFIAGGDNNVQT
ncbi:MAG: hypothetical protein ACYTCN_10655, partial [Planctomycetota bacterium]